MLLSDQELLLAANGLVVLYITINLLSLYYGTEWEGLFEATIATAAIVIAAIIVAVATMVVIAAIVAATTAIH